MAATTFTITATSGSASKQYFWKITSSIGNIKLFPVGEVNLEVKVSTTTDYQFIFSRNEVDQFQCNVNQITLIGSSAPAGNNSATDLTSILALI